LLGAALERAAAVRAAIEAIDGLHVQGRADFCGPGLGHDFDPLPVVIDVSGLGTSGYRAADRLREQYGVDAHLADHRRISTQLTHADDESTTQPLLAALRALAAEAAELGSGPEVVVPPPEQLRLEQVLLPRDAYFGEIEDVPVAEAAGRVTAEMLTPYPPGIPAALPGERLTEPLLRYLRTGIEAGMNLPDAVDTSLRTVRVVVE
jgi:lysine decarboxylase